jgi:hypothetical protein
MGTIRRRSGGVLRHSMIGGPSLFSLHQCLYFGIPQLNCTASANYALSFLSQLSASGGIVRVDAHILSA